MESENKYIETDLGNVAPNPRGEYDPAEAYEYLDLVEYGGGSYLCVQEAGTVTGIAPAQGKNTEVWQVLTIPGDLTPGYIAIHDDVVNKAESAQADAASTAADREQVESMLANVEQLHTQTETAAQEASDSRDSAAGYATAAEASRMAAADSEKNAQLQVAGFNETVNAAKQEATEEITTARKTAVQEVAAQQVKSVNAVNAAGSAAIENTSADAKEAKDAKAEAVSAANAAEDSAREATAAAEQAQNNKQSAETAAAAAKTSAAAAETAQRAVEGAAGQIETNTAGIEALKEDTAVLQKRQNVLVGSETGNPVSCDDAFPAPLCGLNVYGKSTQDGTPSPDNPVPIVSAGDDGSVAVRVTGANMLEGTKPGVKSTIKGITYTTYENGVIITGTATDNSTMFLHDDTIHSLTRGIYYITTSGLSPSVTLNFYFIGKFSSDIQNRQVMLTKNASFSLVLQIEKGVTVNTIVQCALTRNKIATYSHYREQLLTLPSPNGLPGIPVTSGGNYTDQSGQQWVCDEVNFGKSVKVQRIDKGAFDSTKTLAEQNVILAAPIETPLTPDEIAAYKALIAYGPDTVVQASDGAGIKLDYQRDVNLVVKNLEDAIASMTTT